MILIVCFVNVQTWTLAVEEGQRINITIPQFDIEYNFECLYDWLDLSSNNYNSRHCGQITIPWSIITDTNFVIITFFSDNIIPYTGFLAIWSATTAPPTYPPSTGCGGCIFPFLFKYPFERIFDTCTSIDGDQPWCLPAAPTDQGTHVMPKSYCSDTDSSCPSTPQMSTNTNNQPGNCCKFQKLGNLFLTYEI